MSRSALGRAGAAAADHGGAAEPAGAVIGRVDQAGQRAALGFDGRRGPDDVEALRAALRILRGAGRSGLACSEIGARMVADFFEMEGWDTCFLGANTPKESIIETIRAQKADLVALSDTVAVASPDSADWLDGSVGTSCATALIAGAAALLRNNLLIYGVGGVIVPLIGIKLIDMILVAFGWV